jgi:acyl carrier protein
VFENVKDIEQRLLEKIRVANVTCTSDLNIRTAFEDLGLDSLAGVILSEELADELKIRIEPSVFWDFSTIEELAKHLVERMCSERTAETQQIRLTDPTEG